MDAVSRQTWANLPRKIQGGSGRWDGGCRYGLEEKGVCWMQDRGQAREDRMGAAMVGMDVAGGGKGWEVGW